ncbi:MAG: hypothetical protein GEU82_10180 [Luteitalea sp.]|nr:hypothetical protein [Luteitalea sp.]
MVPRVIPFVTGLLLSLGVHRVSGWWLDSGRGVAVMMLMLAATSMLVVWRSGRSPIRPAAHLWAGSYLGMIAALLSTGAGTLWPIVLVVAGMLSAVAIVLGVLASRAIGSSRGNHR